ncbi:MAG: hypothetical protein NTZ97_01635 [Candidatus Moranbacteria bacterium]|nr:hypothetical protein [Candidatus Moranbacteria bacterium]
MIAPDLFHVPSAQEKPLLASIESTHLAGPTPGIKQEAKFTKSVLEKTVMHLFPHLILPPPHDSQDDLDASPAFTLHFWNRLHFLPQAPQLLASGSIHFPLHLSEQGGKGIHAPKAHLLPLLQFESLQHSLHLVPSAQS